MTGLAVKRNPAFPYQVQQSFYRSPGCTVVASTYKTNGTIILPGTRDDIFTWSWRLASACRSTAYTSTDGAMIVVIFDSLENLAQDLRRL